MRVATWAIQMTDAIRVCARALLDDEPEPFPQAPPVDIVTRVFVARLSGAAVLDAQARPSPGLQSYPFGTETSDVNVGRGIPATDACARGSERVGTRCA